MFEKFGFFNKEAKDESQEAHVNTGRIEEVSDDISAPVEEMEGENERKNKMKEAVADMLKNGIPNKKIPSLRPEEALGMERFFIEELQERGVITAKEMSFSGMDDTFRQVVKEVALEQHAEQEAKRESGARAA